VNPSNQKNVTRRAALNNVWLSVEESNARKIFANTNLSPYNYEVLETEESVGAVMLAELEKAAREKEGDLVILLLGGRGAQAWQAARFHAGRAGADANEQCVQLRARFRATFRQ
jgi:hypothetical protein